jgi:hypothetical protein
MKIRFENSFPTANGGNESLALVSLTKLVRLGLLPATAKLNDALSAQVTAKFTAQFPGQMVPASLGDLLLTQVKDADADGLSDINVDDLASLDLLANVSVPPEQLLAKTPFSRDEFSTLANGSTWLSGALADQVVFAQQNIWNEVSESTTIGSSNVIATSFGEPILQLNTPLSVSETGAISLGSAGPTTFGGLTLAMNGNAAYLLITDQRGAVARAYQLTPSGRLKPIAPQTGGMEITDAKPLLAALFANPLVNTIPTLFKLKQQILKAEALRSQVTTPSNSAEKIVWSVAKADVNSVKTQLEKAQTDSGIRPLKWHQWVDDPSDVNTAQAVLDATGGKTDIRPAYLYTIALGEGLMFYLDDANDFQKVDVSMQVNGFAELGTDTFGTSVTELKRKGHVPNWFQEGRDYFLEQSVNEKGETVSSANFANLNTGLIALRGMLADSRQRFMTDAKKTLGPVSARKLTQRQIDYFTYVYFNAGSGFGAKHLKAQGLKAAEKWTDAIPADNRVARFNSLQRISTLQFIESFNAFPKVSPSKIPVAPVTAPPVGTTPVS